MEQVYKSVNKPKDNYLKPEIELIKFNYDDIISTSICDSYCPSNCPYDL